MTKVRLIKYALQYCGLRVIEAILYFMPLDFASDIFARLARIIGPRLKVHKTAYNNIRTHFSQDEQLIANIMDEMWDNLGRYVVEFIKFPRLSEQEINKRITIKGVENIQAILDSKTPMLILTGHFANWEAGLKPIANLLSPLAMVYRPANNIFVDKMIMEKRFLKSAILIPKGNGGSRLLMRAIKEKRHIIMLMDQKMTNGIPVKFFNAEAMTSSAPATFALKYNYEIVPMRMIRISRTSKFTLEISPPMLVNQDDDEFAITLRANDIIANWVADTPGQWFWLHNRWRNSNHS